MSQVEDNSIYNDELPPVDTIGWNYDRRFLLVPLLILLTFLILPLIILFQTQFRP